MEIIKRSQGISVRKQDGTDVIYYIFLEYEIHHNEVPLNTVQQWHSHNVIEETIYLISGELEVHWFENGKKVFQTLYPGDIVRVENTPHTFINSSTSVATFLVIRLVLTGKDNRELIKNDKLLQEVD